MKIKIAGTGYRFNGRILPVGTIYGVCDCAYKYYSVPWSEREIKRGVAKGDHKTIKQLEKCKPFKFICTRFDNLEHENPYKKEMYPVFDISIYDEIHQRWIDTTTEARSDYYYLGEVLLNTSIMYNLHNTIAFDNHISRRYSPCKLRENAPYTKAGRAYGYMCKSPDRTTTEYDLVGDEFAENRRFKK